MHPPVDFARNAAGAALPALADGFEPQAGRISRRASTVPQPFVAANFSGSQFVGGETLSEGRRDQILSALKKMGATITEIEI